MNLQGVCHEIFDLQFFHDSNPSGPMTKTLKNFRIHFLFRRDIQIFKKLRGTGMHRTADSDSAVCIIPQSQESKMSQKTPRSASYCDSSAHHTTESVIYEVSVLIRSFTNVISL